MEKSVFNYTDYKEYLRDILETSGKTRGQRSKLAEALNCQTTFISQVLNGDTHFSLEHAISINEFLGHTSDEKHYFMLLVLQGRAGSETLKKYFMNQIQSIHKNRQIVRERIGVRRTVSIQDQMIYYSSWYYVAVHIMLSIPKFQTKTEIANHLKLPLNMVSECLDYLVSVGLAATQGDKFKIGESRVHLGTESPMLSKHLTNWRLRAIESIDRKNPNNLHYSSVLSVSEKDAPEVKGALLATIEKLEPLIRESKEEGVYCLSTDFFQI